MAYPITEFQAVNHLYYSWCLGIKKTKQLGYDPKYPRLLVERERKSEEIKETLPLNAGQQMLSQCGSYTQKITNTVQLSWREMGT